MAVPGLKASHMQEAKRMAEVYPLLYVFENSARDLIDGVLTEKLGSDWWSKVATTKLQSEVSVRQKSEGHEAWHGKRGAHPIQYTDLPDLVTLVSSAAAWPHLRAILANRQTWFQGIVEDLNVSRRVVAHMNPLASDDVKQVQAAFAKWSKQLDAKRDLIPQP